MFTMRNERENKKAAGYLASGHSRTCFFSFKFECSAGEKVLVHPPQCLVADGHSSPYSLVINYFTAHLVDKWFLIYKQDSADGTFFFWGGGN